MAFTQVCINKKIMHLPIPSSKIESQFIIARRTRTLQSFEQYNFNNDGRDNDPANEVSLGMILKNLNRI